MLKSQNIIFSSSIPSESSQSLSPNFGTAIFPRNGGNSHWDPLGRNGQTRNLAKCWSLWGSSAEVVRCVQGSGWAARQRKTLRLTSYLRTGVRARKTQFLKSKVLWGKYWQNNIFKNWMKNGYTAFTERYRLNTCQGNIVFLYDPLANVMRLR